MSEDDLDFEVIPDPEADAERADAKAFLNGLEGAKESGMESEYVIDVIRAIKKGETMTDAIFYAYCEWDL